MTNPQLQGAICLTNHNLNYCDERTELLDTVKDIASDEVDLRVDVVTTTKHDPHPEHPPPH